jgi:hypothetical protein
VRFFDMPIRKITNGYFFRKPPAKQLNQFKRLSAMNKTAFLLALVLSVNSFAQSNQTKGEY